MKVEYIYGWSDVAALIMAGCNILYGRWFLGGESSCGLSHYCMRHQNQEHLMHRKKAERIF